MAYYDKLSAKDAIAKATIDHSHANKLRNTALADKIANALQRRLDALEYDWKKDPYALEILDESKNSTMHKHKLAENYERYFGKILTENRAEIDLDEIDDLYLKLQEKFNELYESYAEDTPANDISIKFLKSLVDNLSVGFINWDKWKSEYI